jgi:hypothetical protein
MEDKRTSTLHKVMNELFPTVSAMIGFWAMILFGSVMLCNMSDKMIVLVSAFALMWGANEWIKAEPKDRERHKK